MPNEAITAAGASGTPGITLRSAGVAAHCGSRGGARLEPVPEA